MNIPNKTPSQSFINQSNVKFANITIETPPHSFINQSNVKSENITHVTPSHSFINQSNANSVNLTEESRHANQQSKVKSLKLKKKTILQSHIQSNNQQTLSYNLITKELPPLQQIDTSKQLTEPENHLTIKDTLTTTLKQESQNEIHPQQKSECKKVTDIDWEDW